MTYIISTNPLYKSKMKKVVLDDTYSDKIYRTWLKNIMKKAGYTIEKNVYLYEVNTENLIQHILIGIATSNILYQSEDISELKNLLDNTYKIYNAYIIDNIIQEYEEDKKYLNEMKKMMKNIKNLPRPYNVQIKSLLDSVEHYISSLSSNQIERAAMIKARKYLNRQINPMKNTISE